MRRYFFRKAGVILLAVILIASPVLLMGGCQSRPTLSSDAGLVIVTSFLPMYIFTANLVVGVDGVSLSNMASPDVGCLHDYQLLPADMIKIESADIFVFNGAGMEGFLVELAGENGDVTLIDASEGIELLPMADGTDNPHVWLSVRLAIQQVRNISRSLQAADPGHQALYKANEEMYVKKLAAIDDLYRERLKTLGRRDIITFHEAFPYLADEYGMTIAAVIEREPGSEPSAAALAQTIDLIRQTGTPALFAEPQYSPIIAQTIAAETNAQIYNLDPIVTGKAAAGTYEEKMMANLDVLVLALKD